MSLKFLIQLGFTMFLLDFYSGTSSSKMPLICIGNGSCCSMSPFPSDVAASTEVIAETAPCGAVRHGAECCNLYFPQELDDEYLIVWQGFSGKPWDYKTEATPEAAHIFELRFFSRAGDIWGWGWLMVAVDIALLLAIPDFPCVEPHTMHRLSTHLSRFASVLE